MLVLFGVTLSNICCLHDIDLWCPRLKGDWPVGLTCPLSNGLPITVTDQYSLSSSSLLGRGPGAPDSVLILSVFFSDTSLLLIFSSGDTSLEQPALISLVILIVINSY